MPRAREAGGHLALGLEPHVPRRGDSRLFARPFIDDLLREHETEVRRCLQKARTRCRSISPRAGWR